MAKGRFKFIEESSAPAWKALIKKVDELLK